MYMSANDITEQLRGFGNVLSLKLQFDGVLGYDLELLLADDAEQQCRLLLCKDVSLLSIENFGGGLHQLRALQATDLRSQQLDRIKLSFYDKASENFSFSCAAAEITNITASLEASNA
jgi:hypothetical protein